MPYSEERMFSDERDAAPEDLGAIAKRSPGVVDARPTGRRHEEEAAGDGEGRGREFDDRPFRRAAANSRRLAPADRRATAIREQDPEPYVRRGDGERAHLRPRETVFDEGAKSSDDADVHELRRL